LKSHKLYPKGVQSPYLDERCKIDKDCKRCELGNYALNRCIPADGDPGGILFVGEGPGRHEDEEGRPFVGQSGSLLRRIVAKHSTGPVAFGNAMGCYPGAMPVKDRHVEACRPYLAQTIVDARPTRIVTLGAWAAYAVLGRSVPPFSSRGAYSWVQLDGKRIPVFTCTHPAAALRNSFVRGWFELDLIDAMTRPEPHALFDGIFHEVQSLVDARAAIWDLTKNNEPVAYDVETAGTVFEEGFRILSIALCSATAGPYVWTREAFTGSGFEELRTWFEDERFPKFGHNAKFDCVALRGACGITVRGTYFDTRLVRKLLEPEADARLSCCAELVGLGGHKDEAESFRADAAAKLRKEILAERRAVAKVEQTRTVVSDFRALVEHSIDRGDDHARWSFGLLPPRMLHRYNARDAHTTAMLGGMLENKLNAEPELKRVWDVLVRPANDAFSQIEIWGFKVSRQAIYAFDAYLEMKVRDLQQQLDGYAKDINWDSPKQVGGLLFGKLGLKPPKETASGQHSVDSGVLQTLRAKHPLPGLIADRRHYAKLRSSYGVGLLDYVRDDGRMHANYLLDGARSGRLSATDPAVQTIPRPSGNDDEPEGKMARDCFVAEDGYVLVSADYSQIELRIAAFYSGDPEMIEIFKSGVDYHQRTAELISQAAWGIEPHQVEKKHRSASKSTTFGLIYGMFDATLAQRIGCTVAEAGRIREAVLGKFRRLAAWLEEQKTHAREHGFVRTYWDGQPARRRPAIFVLDADQSARTHAENSAMNSPIQGGAADYCLASISEIVRWIREDAIDAKVVATIHDSIIVEAKETQLTEITGQIERIMTSWNCGDVPLKVDIEVGKSWGSLKAWGKV
jgi:uracil-DNA glycosylase family 4